MKATNNIANYILVKADTNSDWDNCQFALIHCTKEWKEQMQQRLQTLSLVENESGFASLNYYDAAVDFYCTDEDEQPDINALLSGKDWTFVELDEDEQNTLLTPENRLDSYRLRFYQSGTAIYSAYGKLSGEEFYTAEFSVSQILNHYGQAVKIIQLY